MEMRNKAVLITELQLLKVQEKLTMLMKFKKELALAQRAALGGKGVVCAERSGHTGNIGLSAGRRGCWI